MIKKKDLSIEIFIDNDLTKMKREIQKQLKDRAKEERERKEKQYESKLHKIFVKDKWLQWNKREKRIEEDNEKKRMRKE